MPSKKPTTVKKRTKAYDALVALVERYVIPSEDWHNILLPHLARMASFYDDGETVQYSDLCKDLAGQYKIMQELNPAIAEQMILFGDIERAGWTRIDTYEFQVNHANIAADLPPIVDRRPRATWLLGHNATKPTVHMSRPVVNETFAPQAQPTVKPRTLCTRVANRLRRVANYIDPQE